MLKKLIVAILFLTLFLGSTIQAQTQAVTISVTPQLAGHAKFGEWLPLQITLDNNGGDLDAELRVAISQNGGDAVYATAAPLPAGARKTITLNVRPPSFADTVEVQLVEGDTLLEEQEVAIDLHRHNVYLLGVLSSESSNFNLLSGLDFDRRVRTELVTLTPDDLPARAEALRSLDSLIISDVDTTALSADQQAALHLWVSQGGRLLIGGGIGAQRTLAGLPDELRIVELGDSAELNTVNSLADFADNPNPYPWPLLRQFASHL